MAIGFVRTSYLVAFSLSLLIFAAALAGGCVSRTSANQSRSGTVAALPAPDVWPARDQAWADAAAAVSVPRDVDWFTRDTDGKPTDGKAELGNVHGSFLLMFGEGRIEAASRAGVGVVRDIRRGRQESLTEKERENSVNHFVTFTSRLPDGSCLVESYAGKVFRTSREGLEAKSAAIHRAGLTPADIESQLALNQGMAFFLDPPWMHSKGFTLPAESETPSRGIFFLVLGLGGADADYHVLFDEVSRRGWRIVLIPTGSMSYVPDAPFTIDSDAPESIDHAGADLGDFVDQRLGELAYTVEGATDFLSRTHPELAGKPVVVFGYSGGAIAAPAIAARLKHTMPGRLGALIAVCGGSNLVSIAQHSIVIDFDRFVHWSNGPGWSGNDRLSDAYLRHTRLDPAVVGRSLWDVPTLLVKARIDWAIPGSASNQFYDDLGRPERWSYLAGHESVLERLASDRVRFADWLDTTVPKQAAP